MYLPSRSVASEKRAAGASRTSPTLSSSADHEERMQLRKIRCIFIGQSAIVASSCMRGDSGQQLRLPAPVHGTAIASWAAPYPVAREACLTHGFLTSKPPTVAVTVMDVTPTSFFPDWFISELRSETAEMAEFDWATTMNTALEVRFICLSAFNTCVGKSNCRGISETVLTRCS